MPTFPYTSPPVIVIHALAASIAVVLGAWLLWARQGHRAYCIGG
jgi:hypothetical protein